MTNVNVTIKPFSFVNMEQVCQRSNFLATKEVKPRKNQNSYKDKDSMSLNAPNFTQIPNSVFDYWIPRLKPASGIVLLVMCRKIFGWHKTSDHISKNQLCRATGLSKNTVQSAIEELESFELIIKKQITTEYGCQPNTYTLNVIKPIDFIYTEADQNLGGGGSEIDLGVGQELTGGVGQNLTPQKKDITKERLTKEKGGETPPTKNKKEQKTMVQFGAHVQLKEGEYEKLVGEMGQGYVDFYLTAINNHVPNAKQSYSDFAAVVRQWYLRDRAKNTLPNLQKIKETELPPSPDRLQANRRMCESVENKLRHKFTSLSLFQAGTTKADLVNKHKDFKKEYEYDKVDPKQLREILLNDLETCFPGARDILLGKTNQKITSLMSNLSEKYKMSGTQ